MISENKVQDAGFTTRQFLVTLGGGIIAAGALHLGLRSKSEISVKELEDLKTEFNPVQSDALLTRFGQRLIDLIAQAYPPQYDFFDEKIEAAELRVRRDAAVSLSLAALCEMIGVDLGGKTIPISKQHLEVVFEMLHDFAWANGKLNFAGHSYSSSDGTLLLSLGLFGVTSESKLLPADKFTVHGLIDLDEGIRVYEYSMIAPSFDPSFGGVSSYGTYYGNVIDGTSIIYPEKIKFKAKQIPPQMKMTEADLYETVRYNEAGSAAYEISCQGLKYQVDGTLFALKGTVSHDEILEFFGDYFCLRNVPSTFLYQVDLLVQYDPKGNNSSVEWAYAFSLQATRQSMQLYFNRLQDPASSERAAIIAADNKQQGAPVLDEAELTRQFAVLGQWCADERLKLVYLKMVPFLIKSPEVQAGLQQAFIETYEKYVSAISTHRTKTQ